MIIGVLASGRGSNLQAIMDASGQGRLSATVGVVISNNSRSGALKRARDAGVRALHLSGHTHPDPVQLDEAICATLREHGCQWVALAGYMKRLGPLTLREYEGRIVNVHPALLPRHGGQGMYGERVHESVLASGDQVSGVTVHLVGSEYDRGQILAQRQVPVYPDDTVEGLAERVLAVEHELYVETLDALVKGRIQVDSFGEQE